MKKKVILTIGIPASGKSFWAKEEVANNSKLVRVNKDDIRAMLGQKWSREIEKIAVDTEIRCAVAALRGGYSVIIDDTNLNPNTRDYVKKSIRTVFDENAVDIEEKVFDVDPKVCIERDSKREGKAKVGAAVIMSMYNKYIKKDADVGDSNS